MNSHPYTTNKRLWAWIALTLFLVSWFLPLLGSKTGGVLPVKALWMLLAGLFGGDMSSRDVSGFSIVLLGFALIACLVALFLGWLLQCFAVILTHRNRKQTTDEH